MSNRWTPTPWQVRVLAIPERFNLALAGGRALGKSVVLLMLALRHVTQYAGRVLVIRRSYPALRELEQRLIELFGIAMPAARYDRGEHTMICPNGGAVELGFLEGESDLARYLGRECTMLAFDELTMWPSLHALNRLRGNLRSTVGIPTRTVFTAMPGGPGHSAVTSKFIQARPRWEPFELEPGGDDQWVLAGGNMTDNPTLPSSYADTLRAACADDPAQLAGWLDGDFERMGGAFFAAQFGEHSIIRGDDAWRCPPRDLRYTWEPPLFSSYWSCDWGISAPAVALGIVVPRRQGIRGPGGKVYPKNSRIVLCEVTSANPSDISRGMNWSVDQLADELKAAGALYGINLRGPVDDARGLGADETVVSEFRRCGVYMTRAVKGSRIAGWSKLKNMMHAAKIQDPDAPWFVVHERCRFTTETMLALPRDPRRPDDADTSANDHSADAARMGVLYELGIDTPRPFLIY